jgi:hypothetical protein
VIGRMLFVASCALQRSTFVTRMKRLSELMNENLPTLNDFFSDSSL